MLIAMIFGLFAEISTFFILKPLFLFANGTQEEKKENFHIVAICGLIQIIYFITVIAMLFASLTISLVGLGILIMSFIHAFIKTKEWKSFKIKSIVNGIICIIMLSAGIICLI